MNAALQKPIIVISWDGLSKPLNYLQIDAPLDFNLFVFDYSGQDHSSALSHLSPTFYYSQKTECKGDLIQAVYEYDLSVVKYLLSKTIHISLGFHLDTFAFDGI